MLRCLEAGWVGEEEGCDSCSCSCPRRSWDPPLGSSFFLPLLGSFFGVTCSIMRAVTGAAPRNASNMAVMFLGIDRRCTLEAPMCGAASDPPTYLGPRSFHWDDVLFVRTLQQDDAPPLGRHGTQGPPCQKALIQASFMDTQFIIQRASAYKHSAAEIPSINAHSQMRQAQRDRSH
jgi:hypothetical protein